MRKDMPRFPKFALLLLAVGTVLFSGCGEKEEAPGPVTMGPDELETWEIALVEMRIEKNEEFSRAERSPLPAADIEGFEGLNYYFPKTELRFRTPFVAEAGTDTVGLTKRKGQVVPYIRRGTLAFSHENKVHHLEVFGPADTRGGDYLWLPFFDDTSGKATYAGGRYLDVTIDSEGMVDLDFNYAYNPLCDYNPDKFNCTLPPMSNKLSFAVEAGEQSFGTGH
ncbi:MAG: DUF1684 domain-containing protein [Candidatus Krumholzibacteriota bacterium]